MLNLRPADHKPQAAIVQSHAALIAKIASAPPIPIAGGSADEYDARERVAHMAHVVSACVQYIAACSADLNDNLAVTSRVQVADFRKGVTDMFDELAAGFAKSAEQIVEDRYDGAPRRRRIRIEVAR